MSMPLNIGKVILGAFVIPWQNRKAFALALAMPLILMVGLTLSWHYAGDHLPATAKWGLYFLYAALFVVISVTCHRLVLTGAQVPGSRFSLKWTSRETRFLSWVLRAGGVFILAFLSIVLLVSLMGAGKNEPDVKWPEWLVLVVKIPAFYLLARCSLVFPAAALDRKVTFHWAWNLSRNNGWRLVLLVAFLPGVLSHATGVLYRDTATVIETIALNFLGWLFIVVEIAAISLAYLELIKGEGDAISEPTSPLDPDVPMERHST